GEVDETGAVAGQAGWILEQGRAADSVGTAGGGRGPGDRGDAAERGVEQTNTREVGEIEPGRTAARHPDHAGEVGEAYGSAGATGGSDRTGRSREGCDRPARQDDRPQRGV